MGKAENFGIAKWIPYTLIPLSMLILLNARLILPIKIETTLIPIYLGLLISYELIFNKNLFVASNYLVFSCFGAVLLFLVKRENNSPNFIRFSYITLLSLLLISLVSLSKLTNWGIFIALFNSPFYISPLISFLLITFLSYLLFSVKTEKSHFLYIRYLIYITAGFCFLYLAFRHDSLFNETMSGNPAYHWEYYVGVIETLRNGGWLLWDTPSQYGFLNILIPAILPISSAWESLYIFQGFLLFISSYSLFLKISQSVKSIKSIVLIFLILLFSFFFADPEFIGPYPFPSSSVTRFFCIYLVLLSLTCYPYYSLRQAAYLGICLPITLMWSAESFIYGFSIYIFTITPLIFKCFRRTCSIAFIIKYLSICFLPTLLIFVLVLLFYYLKLHHLPDLFLLFDYALGYAGGFGYVPFTFSGPGNFLLLLFSAVMLILLGSFNSNQKFLALFAAICGAIWAISSYYIGRPVPQNITAMLPILGVASLLGIFLFQSSLINFYTYPLRAISLPLFFIILLPVSNPSWYVKIISSKSFEVNIENKLRSPNNDLLEILKKTDNKNIIFYGDGDDAVPPNLNTVFNKKIVKAWLPTPLQLFENPLREARRNLILGRYVCRNKPEHGYIIATNNEGIINRINSINLALSVFYKIEAISKNSLYILYEYTNLDLKKCGD
jgi:hypothetical protein